MGGGVYSALENRNKKPVFQMSHVSFKRNLAGGKNLIKDAIWLEFLGIDPILHLSPLRCSSDTN